MRNIAIIGGTGIYSPHTFTGFTEKIVETPYGKAKVLCGEMAGNAVTFITRHGVGHTAAPHKVNYRANIWALKSLGVEEIFATTAVGSLNPEMTAGHFVVCDQILDFTKSRINTFYDSTERGVAHVDFTFPYCPRLREKVITCLTKTDIPFHKTGTYVTAEGPRFETAAEIKMFRMLGGDVVGMTNMPEAILAREAEMCYTNCSIVTNMGAGISPTPLSHSEVVEEMGKSIKNMEKLIFAFINANNTDIVMCNCAEALKEFGGFKL
ncbi:MAG: S-methyl-5'-thioadenosine phosphorylase [Acidaminococcaceae bacterium]|nr:S-methyl-5'-thioadenosine phosphorylase [Acidaminococcaceae bacterium]